MKRIDKAIEMATNDDNVNAMCRVETGKTMFTRDDIINDMCPREFGMNEYEYEKCDADVMCNHCWHEEVEETEIEAASDAIKPKHYNAGKFDVIWFCQYHNLPFDIGNIIKYAFRAGKKDKDKEVQDLEKAIEYANRRIEFVKGE